MGWEELIDALDELETEVEYDGYFLEWYNKSAVLKLPKKRGGKAMKRYDENFKIEALKLSDEIGVKKACEQLNVNYGRFIFSRWNSVAEKHCEFAVRQTSRII